MTSAAAGAGGDAGREVPPAEWSRAGGTSQTREELFIKLGTFGESLAELLLAEYADPTGTQPIETARTWVEGCLFAVMGLPADDPGSLAVQRFFAALLDLFEAVEQP